MSVVGPITIEDWNTMRLLNSSINWYKRTRDPRYTRALNKELEIYKDYLRKYRELEL